MRLTTKAFCALSTLPIFVAGCSTDTPEETVGAKGASLVQAQSCDDLLTQIQNDAITKLNEQAARYKELDRNGVPGRGDPAVDFDDGELASGDGDGDATSGDSPPMNAPGNGSEEGVDGGDTGGESDPKSHSDTNTQVKDVDEADIVKVSEDGKRMFILHGNDFKIVDAWPPEEAGETGSLKLEGRGYELFVSGEQAVVFSFVNPEGIPDKGETDKPRCAGCCSYENFTKISVLDVSGAAPVLKREMLFEGDYVSSRRYDDTVRAVVRGGFAAHDLYYPYIDTYDSFGRPKSEERLAEDIEAWRAGVEADIRSTTLDDWIPRSFEKNGDAYEQLSAACEGYYIPAPGLVAGGVTRVVTFDMSSDAAPSMTSILGGSEVVYSNRSTMVVTQNNWMWDVLGEGGGTKTSVHAFSIEGASTDYDGSGFAPGYLENQFSIHEKEGVIFLSTTDESEQTDWEPQNTILSMKKDEDGSLEVLDRSDNMGEPGETIYATRFLGDRAYVVTFRTTDPLYAVDLSDPEDIDVLGELHIPGFSEYIHPLGSDHLLTIGMETDGGGFVEFEGDGDRPEVSEQGVSLQIFDISDATAPALVHKEVFDMSWESEALYNHKAFTFVDDYFDQDSSLLLFPLTTSSPSYQVGLQVMQVSVEDGFSALGNIDHSSLLGQKCDEESEEYCYYSGQMRRGVQIDDYIYALSDGGLSIHAIAQPSGEGLAQLAFEAPQNDYYCGYRDHGEPGVDIDEPGGVGGDSGGDGDISVEPPDVSVGSGGSASMGGASGDGDSASGSDEGEPD